MTLFTMKDSSLPKDTTLEAEKVRISVFKKIGAEGRFRMTIDLSDNPGIQRIW
jgi:hypothetical protein